MTDAELVAELRVCSRVVPYRSISRRELVSEAAAAIERLTADRDEARDRYSTAVTEVMKLTEKRDEVVADNIGWRVKFGLMKAERDALAARVERLTRLEWDGPVMSLGAIQFGSIWNGTEEYETPGWRAVLNSGDHVGVYATEAEARAALEAAAMEATR